MKKSDKILLIKHMYIYIYSTYSGYSCVSLLVCSIFRFILYWWWSPRRSKRLRIKDLKSNLFFFKFNYNSKFFFRWFIVDSLARLIYYISTLHHFNHHFFYYFLVLSYFLFCFALKNGLYIIFHYYFLSPFGSI